MQRETGPMKILSLLKTLIYALLALFAPIQAACATALCLCLLDLFTGLLASRKQDIGITSNGLKKTLSKIVVYEAAILLTFLVDTYLTGVFPLANIVSGLIGITELKSVLENLNILAGGDLLKSILLALSNQTSINNEIQPVGEDTDNLMEKPDAPQQ